MNTKYSNLVSDLEKKIKENSETYDSEKKILDNYYENEKKTLNDRILEIEKNYELEHYTLKQMINNNE